MFFDGIYGSIYGSSAIYQKVFAQCLRYLSCLIGCDVFGQQCVQCNHLWDTRCGYFFSAVLLLYSVCIPEWGHQMCLLYVVRDFGEWVMSADVGCGVGLYARVCGFRTKDRQTEIDWKMSFLPDATHTHITHTHTSEITKACQSHFNINFMHMITHRYWSNVAPWSNDDPSFSRTLRSSVEFTHRPMCRRPVISTWSTCVHSTRWKLPEQSSHCIWSVQVFCIHCRGLTTC